MSRFNAKTKTAPVKTTSYEGGTLWEKKLEEEWVNFLFSSMLTGGFYESDDTQIARYLELTDAMLDKYGADFVAKAAVLTTPSSRTSAISSPNTSVVSMMWRRSLVRSMRLVPVSVRTLLYEGPQTIFLVSRPTLLESTR